MNIYDLKKTMESFSLTDFSADSLKLLTRISRHSELREILDSIVNDPVELCRVAENSFIHNLGFIRINLIGWETSKCMIKLHIWNLENENEPATDELDSISIHNHLYDFRSALLTGEMVFKIYCENEIGSQYHKYENPIANDKYIFNHKTNCCLQELLEVNTTKSSSYFINHNTIHFAYVKKKVCTATICIQSELKKNFTSLYTKGILNDLPKTSRYTVENLRNTIYKFLEVL